MLSAETITVGAALLIGALIGAFLCAVAYESRNERAFADRFRQRLASLVAGYRTADGGRPGVLLPMTEAVENPVWARRRAVDRQAPVWPGNPAPPARHRPEYLTDDTRSFSRAEVDAVLAEGRP